jgi:ribosomal protein S18 acetylase RimI-like enzyme
MIEVNRVHSIEQLKSIAALQQLNLRKNLSSEDADGEGFLTAEYSLDILKAMHAQEPAIIATKGGELVGYALIATKTIRGIHPLLSELFNTIDRLEYKGKLLKESEYVVVGQLCVSKEYRGQGVVSKLYNHFRDSLALNYPYCVTDVATANLRSLNAHKRCGFTVINHTEYGGIGWEVVLWDWRQD